MKPILSYQWLKQVFYDFMAWTCYGPTPLFHGNPTAKKLQARAEIKEMSEVLRDLRVWLIDITTTHADLGDRLQEQCLHGRSWSNRGQRCRTAKTRVRDSAADSYAIGEPPRTAFTASQPAKHMPLVRLREASRARERPTDHDPITSLKQRIDVGEGRQTLPSPAGLLYSLN